MSSFLRGHKQLKEQYAQMLYIIPYVETILI